MKKLTFVLLFSILPLFAHAQCVGLTDLEQRKIVVDYFRTIKEKIYPRIKFDQKSSGDIFMVGLTITYNVSNGKIIRYDVLSQNKENANNSFYYSVSKAVDEALSDKQLPQGFKNLCLPPDRETNKLMMRFVSNKENFIE